MALYILDNDRNSFPDPKYSMPDGLLAMGGDLNADRLIEAYRKGIFPWYEGDIPLWWCPDPRFVLFPEELRISKSMKVLIKRNTFRFTVDEAFHEVVRACRLSKRKDQDGTWINDEVENGYGKLAERGLAHSAESWLDGQLVGGLYGVKMGSVFFGESMFMKKSNASKYAFIRYCTLLKEQGVKIIDCQVHTDHLESLGGRFIPRTQFLEYLNKYL